ncbi:MAG: endolytic transglycosylase MltG [Gammaproteobacteria bacterium]|nr:endolytic transglycosylase MltG [Gammaproteobacteria bacterium]MBU1646616.1 endolytic transglycosylase MltG [Gammaproteobacteria bacterium]MBU1972873.1 endolytic transglycosylase MltG [Gammaproteobacteria bacterium]
MRLFKRLLLLCLLAAIGFSGWMAWFAFAAVPLKVNPRGAVDFDIRPGLGLKGAASVMVATGVDFMPWQFALLGRLAGMDRNIKAGSYEVVAGVTPWDLLQKLTLGDVTQTELVLVEGRTFRQFRAQIDAHADLRHDTMGLSDAELLQRLGIADAHPEGLFFPDTYLFAKQSSDLAILARAHEAMQRRLAAEWDKRDTSVPYKSPYQALIMASIVEKETGLEADRGKVASVFVNRLRRGMLLQTDPTVIYGMGLTFDGNIRKRDLTADTPWNTYTRAGLPPTPIAMPGLASIQAALRPPATDFLYFVARGDGSSVFSRTLEEHNRAVTRYQRGGRG